MHTKSMIYHSDMRMTVEAGMTECDLKIQNFLLSKALWKLGWIIQTSSDPGREDLSLEWSAGDTPIVLGISASLWKDYLLYEVT